MPVSVFVKEIEQLKIAQESSEKVVAGSMLPIVVVKRCSAAFIRRKLKEK